MGKNITAGERNPASTLAYWADFVQEYQPFKTEYAKDMEWIQPALNERRLDLLEDVLIVQSILHSAISHDRPDLEIGQGYKEVRLSGEFVEAVRLHNLTVTYSQQITEALNAYYGGLAPVWDKSPYNPANDPESRVLAEYDAMHARRDAAIAEAQATRH